MFAASKTSKANGTTPAATDPQFNYVTMLLHGDGTNGAQNNTFVDSSTNNFTITRNGTPTQGSFSPYGTLWGNYFPGSGSFIQASGSQNQNLLGNGDFTIEAWVFSSTSTFNQTIVTTTSLATGARGFGWNLRFEGGYNIRFYVGSGTSGSDNEFLLATSTGITINTWNHIAVVRNGATVYVYVNGVQKGSAAMPATYNLTGTVPCQIGQRGTSLPEPIIGNISNCRIVAGTALYTSNFTPSTTPLTAVSGTSLLTCQSNRFIDNSSNNFAITVTGTPSVQRFSPFEPSMGYTTSAIGGSGYFPGTTSGLRTNFQPITTGPFTVEFWVNPASYKSTMLTVSNRAWNTGNNRGWWVEMNSTGQIILKAGQGGFATWPTILTSSGTAPLNQWTHIACVRDSSNVIRFYINGIADANTVTYSASLDQSNGTPTGTFCTIGVEYSDNAYQSSTVFIGYLSNIRINPSTAVYTAAFTPPTAPLTAITNTSLLLNCVNAGIYDNAMMNDLVTVGNAQVSTSVKKYGTGSLAFDESGDYLTTITTPNLQFGTGDFTVEFWMYFIARDTLGACIFANYNNFTTGALSFFAGHNTGSATKYQVACNGTFPAIQSTATVTYNQWDHFAVVRSGSTLTLYINGVANGTFSVSGITLNGVGSNWIFGAALDAPTNYELNGYIDDLRITKGYARYTANFTPPTAALPNY